MGRVFKPSWQPTMPLSVSPRIMGPVAPHRPVEISVVVFQLVVGELVEVGDDQRIFQLNFYIPKPILE